MENVEGMMRNLQLSAARGRECGSDPQEGRRMMGEE